jgi:transposase
MLVRDSYFTAEHSQQDRSGLKTLPRCLSDGGLRNIACGAGRFGLPSAQKWCIKFVIISKRNVSKLRPGADFFLRPKTARQRQYEALRAYLVDGLPATDAAKRFGYSELSLHSWCRELRKGRLEFFPATKPGPKAAPKRDAVRERVVQLRKKNYSVYDIQKILRAENRSLSHVAIHQTLKEEGFAKLPRRLDEERPNILRPDIADIADIRQVNWANFRSFETEGSALFVLLPVLVDWGIHHWVRRAGLPGSKMIPALQSFLSMLALKLVGKERLSHVMDVVTDPGFALFARLNVLPKTTALSTYSYRVTRRMTTSLLQSYVRTLTRTQLLPGDSFNLDFHTIPHRGDQAVLEKHYVSRRSRREKGVLVFLVQDNTSRALCYANATVRKETAADEILEFVEFWKATRRKLPRHLVFDSQLTTYEVLAQLDKRNILFVTLRRRGSAIMKNLKSNWAAWKKLRLAGVSRQYRHVRYVESTVSLKPIRRPIRQIAVAGLGHDEPTLFVTNDLDIPADELIERYAHRMLIENSIAENIGFFYFDALSSAIVFQVDLDVMLTLIANAAYRQLARRLTGFETAQPKQIFRRFLNTPARVTVTDDEVHVRMRRCTHHPILLASDALDPQPTVPWWDGRRLRLEVR